MNGKEKWAVPNTAESDHATFGLNIEVELNK